MTSKLWSSRSILAVATLLGFFSTGSVRAQSVYGGVGLGFRPYGLYGGYYPGYLGVYPGAYNGFWSNGLSLYGPPVPTYGTVPGTFGGADQRLSNFSLPPNIQMYNGANLGLGGSGAGGAGPRRRHWSEGATVGGLNAPTMGQATIEVRVPVVEAEVFFEAINTRQTGLKRQFQTPLIQAGATYFYKVRAHWKQDGKEVDQVRTVPVRANESFVVDFTQPEPVENVKPIVGNEGPQ
jgi:uncharacterized protein (TIGR03000 family)